ncbi:hypothetical protein L1856_21635 [Streptomyces sp. Tue 6430]|nr:hypothetical protein [Streptomyces sp. Tue 6430]
MTTTAATDADEPGNSTTATTAGVAGTSGVHPRFAEALDAPGPDAPGPGDPLPCIRRLPDAVRAAAGTPHTVFPTASGELVGRAGATVVDVRERTA